MNLNANREAYHELERGFTPRGVIVGISLMQQQKTEDHEGHEVSRRLYLQVFPSCDLVPFVVKVMWGQPRSASLP